MNKTVLFFLLTVLYAPLFSMNVSEYAIGDTLQVNIDLSKAKKYVSPYIYGKNNVLPSAFISTGSAAEIKKAKEAGVRFVRQSGGNNSTKYNWKRKLSSHPDWYNNVYANDWDIAAKYLFEKLPGVQGMWSFQLLGKAASNTNNNFNDYGYNQSQWWSGTGQNLAGGGEVNPDGGSIALTDGDPDLYLEDWPADSTVKILDKWFGVGGLGYDKTKIQYWNMDNEPEIWSGTHDDVMPTQCSAEEFMQLYFKVAKAARAKYPEIKLVGPVPANEWQWYRWGNGITVGGKNYCWLEYFIKRVAEEEKATGIRLLDVVDIHYYPSSTDAATCVQFHRVFFDRTYVYPEANGVHTVNGGWDTNINKEYILGRCADWLTKYMGTGHGVKLGVTETGMASTNANVQAVWYASTMGEFMKNDVALFTPWSWNVGMWETLHLFSRYNYDSLVQATSQNETVVSAYPTLNHTSDTMTVVLVNRSVTAKQKVSLNFAGFTAVNENVTMYSLSNLGSNETFESHVKNALVKSSVNIASNPVVELAPLSVNSIIIKASTTSVKPTESDKQIKASAYPNPATDKVSVEFTMNERATMGFNLYNINGQLVKTLANSIYETGPQHIDFDLKELAKGVYFIHVKSGNPVQTLRIIKY